MAPLEAITELISREWDALTASDVIALQSHLHEQRGLFAESPNQVALIDIYAHKLTSHPRARFSWHKYSLEQWVILLEFFWSSLTLNLLGVLLGLYLFSNLTSALMLTLPILLALVLNINAYVNFTYYFPRKHYPRIHLVPLVCWANFVAWVFIYVQKIIQYTT